MQLNRLVRSLRRHLLMGLLLGAILGLGTAALSFTGAKQVYTATDTLLFQVAGQDKVADPSTAVTYSTQLASSYTALLRTPVVIEPVAKQLEMEPAAYAAGLQMVPPRQNLTATISWDDTDPEQARRVVTLTGEQLAKVTQQYTDKVSDQPRIVIAQQSISVLPTPGTGRSLFGSLFKGAAVGFIVLLGWLVLKALTDNGIRDHRDVAEVTDSSVLATVRGDDDAHALARGLAFLDTDEPAVIHVASASKHDGAGALALATARSHAPLGRTLLVDADLREGEATRAAGATDRPGLSELLSGQRSAAEVVASTDGFDLVPSGQLPPNPAELLASPRFAETIASLASGYDTVLVASGPLPTHSDAALVAAACGGTMVVARTRKCSRDQLTQSLDVLDLVAAKPLGIVLKG